MINDVAGAAARGLASGRAGVGFPENVFGAGAALDIAMCIAANARYCFASRSAVMWVSVAGSAVVLWRFRTGKIGGQQNRDQQCADNTEDQFHAVRLFRWVPASYASCVCLVSYEVNASNQPLFFASIPSSAPHRIWCGCCGTLQYCQKLRPMFNQRRAHISRMRIVTGGCDWVPD